MKFIEYCILKLGMGNIYNIDYQWIRIKVHIEIFDIYHCSNQIWIWVNWMVKIV